MRCSEPMERRQKRRSVTTRTRGNSAFLLVREATDLAQPRRDAARSEPRSPHQVGESSVGGGSARHDRTVFADLRGEVVSSSDLGLGDDLVFFEGHVDRLRREAGKENEMYCSFRQVEGPLGS